MSATQPAFPGHIVTVVAIAATVTLARAVAGTGSWDQARRGDQGTVSESFLGRAASAISVAHAWYPHGKFPPTLPRDCSSRGGVNYIFAAIQPILFRNCFHVT